MTSSEHPQRRHKLGQRLEAFKSSALVSQLGRQGRRVLFWVLPMSSSVNVGFYIEDCLLNGSQFPIGLFSLGTL
ncbi:hypothetical protein VUR80DRAFT_3128 [Thermomyces stellatus]